ncbi:hypothetical protein VB779_09375 [Haloarculaceae archaeon H-GB11]|nr:hypothetical protein [Haloarculaceae archaeon H-GB11]
MNLLITLQEDEVRQLQQTGGNVGPVETSSGPLESIWVWITGAITALTGGWVKLRGE